MLKLSLSELSAYKRSGMGGERERERERGGHQLIVPGLLLTTSAPANSLTHTDGHILYVLHYTTQEGRNEGREISKYYIVSHLKAGHRTLYHSNGSLAPSVILQFSPL